MSRSLTTAMAAAVAASTVRPILLFSASMISGNVYYWTGRGFLVVGGQTYAGIGDLLDMTPFEETDDVKANGVTFTLSGVPSGQIELVLGELRNGAPGLVNLALMDENMAIIDSPHVIFSGRLDTGEIDSSDITKPVIRLQYESALIDLERAREIRLTHEEQQKFFPGDRGLEYVPSLIDSRVYWGRR